MWIESKKSIYIVSTLFSVLAHVFLYLIIVSFSNLGVHFNQPDDLKSMNAFLVTQTSYKKMTTAKKPEAKKGNKANLVVKEEPAKKPEAKKGNKANLVVKEEPAKKPEAKKGNKANLVVREDPAKKPEAKKGNKASLVVREDPAKKPEAKKGNKASLVVREDPAKKPEAKKGNKANLVVREERVKKPEIKEENKDDANSKEDNSYQEYLFNRRGDGMLDIIDQSKIKVYYRRIRVLVEKVWTRPPVILPHELVDLSVKLLLSLNRAGRLLSVKVIRTSGNNLFDNSATTAVKKINAFVVPSDERLFNKYFREISMIFKMPVK